MLSKFIQYLFNHVYFLFGLAFFCASANQARAVTVTGTDIRVDYIGTAGPTDLTYRLTVVIYTMCDNSGSIGLRPMINVEVNSKKHNLSMNLPMQRVDPQIGDTLSAFCKGVATSCNDISLMNARPGYIQTTYTSIISLPFQTDDWVFYYWHLGNGRRNTSMNLCDGNIAHVAALCIFNNLDKYNNSSPRFTANPFSYLTVNSPSKIFNETIDPDLDSIVTTPYSSLGCIQVNGATCPTCGFYSEIEYLPGTGYTVNNPITTNPPNSYYVNPSTGNASFSTLNGGSFAFSFKCEEFDRRTGKSLGYVIRDIALPIGYYLGGVFNLDSLPSNLNGAVMAPSGSADLVTCPGSTVTFNIGAQSTAGSIYLFAERTTATGSNFAVTGNNTPSASGVFSWTPGMSDTGQHVILIKGVDSACNNTSYPMSHRKYTTITINVIPGINLGPDLNYCVLEGLPIMISPEKVIPGLNYLWTSGDGSTAQYIDNPNTSSPYVSPPKTTTYVVSTKGLPASCKSSDTITIHVDTLNYLTVTPKSPIVLCDGEMIELDVEAHGPPPYQNLSCGLSGETPPTAAEAKEYLPLNGVLQTTNNAQVTPFNAQATSRHQYLIRASDLLAAGIRSGTLTGLTLFANGNNYSNSFDNFRIHLKCTPNTALDANAFVPGSVPVYATSRLNVPASGRIDFEFDAWYNWDSTQNLIVEICYTNRSGIGAQSIEFYPTVYTSTIFTSNSSGNSVCGGGVSNAGPTALNELPRIEFRYHPVQEAEFQFAWERLMGNYLSDTASKNPSIEIDQRTKYYVHSYGRSGCLLRDSLDVFISARDFNISPLDTTICEGDTAIISTSGGAYLQWFEGDYKPTTTLNCTDCEKVFATPRENTTYTVIMSDSFRCVDTLQMNVTVLEASKVKILNNDTTIKYGQSVNLLATGAEQYVWSPTDFLNNPLVYNPVSTPTHSILYILTGSSSGLCKSYDSVYITVDMRDPVKIPSGFSPNGDGRNDIFKIENLTYQKVVSFRVFNRLGQEVFNAFKENKKGWDGSMKGVPVDMGVYFYEIQIAFPDGQNEVYKGDITLMR